MKSLRMIIIVVCVAVGMGSVVFAGSNSEQDQDQAQGQTLIYAPVSQDNVSVGSLPHPGNHTRTGLLYIPSDQRGRQINNLGSNSIADIFQMYTADGYKMFKESCDEINGKGYFKRVSNNIRRIPAIVGKGKNDVNEVYLIDDFNAVKIKMRPGIEIYGTIAYDPKLDKKWAVNREQVYLFAGDDARSIVKANVMIPLLDAYRNQFRAGSFGADLLGVISKLVAVSNPYGFGFGGGADVTAGRQTMYGESGTTVAFLYIEPSILAELLVNPLDALTRRMTAREKELAECTVQGENNARLHTEQGDDYVKLFKLAKEDATRAKALNGARFEYERALKNGIKDQIEKRRVYGQLSKVYTELALQSETTKARNDHAKKAESYGKKAGFIEAHRLLAIKDIKKKNGK